MVSNYDPKSSNQYQLLYLYLHFDVILGVKLSMDRYFGSFKPLMTFSIYVKEIILTCLIIPNDKIVDD